ncbi:MAG: DNA (cytosine-5)-methyltransferase 1 [Candidatus Nanohaloarchaea archaeon]
MKFLDLFCGGGGLSHGFEKAGMEAVAGIDKSEEALKTFKLNHSAEAINYDIKKEAQSFDVDTVIGSPPCQGFSHARGSRTVEDERNNLVFHFIRWVEELQPRYVVMENVAGIRNISEDFLDKVEERYREAGYRIEGRVLNSAEYGVPQQRERYFVIGVRDDLNTEPGLPDKTHSYREKSQKRLDNLAGSLEDAVTVGDAISDLPDPSENGEVKLDHPPQNRFQEWVREGDKTTQHIAKEPRDEDLDLVRRIPEGKMYRSSRFGDKYVQVWDLYEDRLSEDEQEALWFISRHRTRKDYKSQDKSGPDYIPLEKIDADPEVVRDLFENNWLRRKTDYNGFEEAYDINTKSGVRPKYMRLDREKVSNTVITQSFNPREKLHPVQNRGISLREGARIQSFPDDFEFEGKFKEKARQIGNAVPPLLAYKIAEHLKKLDEEDSRSKVKTV